MEKIFINTDGGARGNPGPAGIGAVIATGGGEVLAEVSRYIGETTNNVAEYEALIAALEKVREIFGEKLKTMEVVVRMDSELIVRQMEGRYKVKNPTLKEKFAEIGQIQGGIPNLSFVHVRREENKHADALVNEAIDAKLGL